MRALRRLRLVSWGKSLALKTAVVAAVVVATNVAGNYALSRGLHEYGAFTTFSPLVYIRAFARPWVAAGVVLMLGWVFSRLTLLSWADLSYVLPVTAISYGITALVGEFYLNEHVTTLDWIGIGVIVLGGGLVAFTYPESTYGPAEKDE